MADGHKWLFGPEGLGVFYSTPSARDRLKLTQFGWHMMKDTHHYENKPWEIHSTARRFECGSPNMLGIHALSASVSLLLETGMRTVETLLIETIDYLRERIEQHADLKLLAPAPSALKSGIVVFRHEKIPNPALYHYLMQHRVICALRGAGIRFSPHFYNGRNQIDRALAIIEQYPD
jgi:selenocysteine lyase/cysteine desulfurase